MKKLAVLISGSGSNLQALIDATEDRIIPAEIVKVYSNKKDAYGLVRAQNHNIDTEVIDDLKVLLDLDVDGIVLAGFLKIIPQEVVQKFENR
ncbi:MAG TPA: formyltransferase family protein, partial [Erysipelothrix sp.]|nr:formyltransferase family protein [Erysipelothrix sp.]